MHGELFFTVNSPGEVATWLTPVVRALRSAGSQARVTVFLVPCTYASGTEAEVVARIPGVDRVILPAESLRYALFGTAPRGIARPKRGALLFLGGEFMLAARLARRLAVPAAAYTEGYINSAGAFERVFVPREQAREKVVARGAAPGRVAVVGDLMVDAARMRLEEAGEPAAAGAPPLRPSGPAGAVAPDIPAGEAGSGGDGPVIALLPGSRPYEVRRGLPFMLRAAAELARRRPGLRFTVPVSPFATAGDFAFALEVLGAGELRRELEALFSPAGDGAIRLRIPVEGRALDVAFERARAARAMAGADLALTIPGSNTAELAVYGVPMIVCVPLDRPEEIPLEGIAGLLDRVPLVGRRLKAAAVMRAARRVEFVALPNRVAGEMVVPELKSAALRPEEVAGAAASLLEAPERLERIRARLVSLMGPEGAARAIAGWLEERLGRGRPD